MSDPFILFAGLGLLLAIVLLVRRGGGRSSPPTRPSSSRSETMRPPAARASAAPPRSPLPEVIEGPAYVVDGDSLVIRKTRIRLFGVDAPELGHPHGRNAKWALHALCKGHRVQAEVVARDAHGRTVARCRLPDGRDLSAEMVRAGLAIDWAKFSGGAYRAMEVPGARKKMWLADARQKGRMDLWEKFEATRRARSGAQ